MTAEYSKIKIYITAAIVLIVVLYSSFCAKDYLLGPSLKVLSPISGIPANDSYLEIKGQAKRIAKIFIDDRQVFTDDQGNFKEPLLLSYGYNIIRVRAEDRFGRKVDEKIQLVLQ